MSNLREMVLLVLGAAALRLLALMTRRPALSTRPPEETLAVWG